MNIEIKTFEPKEPLWRINNIPADKPGHPPGEEAERYKRIPCGELAGDMGSKEEFGNSIYFGCENPYSSSTAINTKSSVFDYLDRYGYLIEIEFCLPCRYIFYDDKPPRPEDSAWDNFIKEIEETISKKYSSPFMNWLGSEGYAFKCLDLKPEPGSVDSKRYEIIIPHKMLIPPLFCDKNLGLYERNLSSNTVLELKP